MSSLPRLFVHADLAPGAFAALDDAQARYLVKVLRLDVGAHVRVFNGRDGEWDAVIDTREGRAVLLKALERLKPQAATPDVFLLFAPLKKTRTDFVVEKATELGVCAIQPVMTERTQTARVRADRLQKIALEAAEQTERLDLPVVRDALTLDAALDALEPDRPVYFCDEAGDAPRMLDALSGRDARTAAVLIGPEGGFSDDERRRLRARQGCVPVTLGPRILRAETAAISALTLYQAALGDWR